MNRTEAAKFLTVSATLTNREPTEQAAVAWSMVLDDITLEDALAALRAHYRSSRFPIMPADIVDQVNLARAQSERDMQRVRGIERQRAENAAHRRELRSSGTDLRDDHVIWENVGWTGDDQEGDSLSTSVPASSIASRSA